MRIVLMLNSEEGRRRHSAYWIIKSNEIDYAVSWLSWTRKRSEPNPSSGWQTTAYFRFYIASFPRTLNGADDTLERTRQVEC